MKRIPSILRKPARRYAPAANLTAPGFTASMTVPSISGIMVTPQTALTFTAFYGAVKTISEDLASLPLLPFQRLPGGGAELDWENPLTRIWDWSPDGECNDLNWREAWISHCLTWGNGYAEIDWDDRGQTRRLMLVHPAVILPKRDQKTYELYYELQTAQTAGGNGRNRRIPPWKILHLAGLGFNGLVGYSPVALHREAIGLGKSAEQYGASFFGNGAEPNGIIECPGDMTLEAQKSFRESWNLMHQGSAGANKIGILTQGRKWVQTSVPPETAQFLASRAFQVLEICRIFRLPPHKLQDFSASTLSNMETANEDYIISCLGPWARRVEKCINHRLIGWERYNVGLYVKHDFRSLILRTAKDEADFYQKMFQIGYYTVDEIKALRRDNPIGVAAGGNKRFVQGQLVDITRAGDPGQASQTKHPDGEPGRPEGSRFQYPANGYAA